MTTSTSDTESRLKPGYASVAALEQFLARIKNRNAPSKIDTNLLLDFGIPGGACPQLLVSLKFLGLIDDQGAPMESFKTLQTPLEEEFRTNLRRIVEVAYVEALSRIDIDKDSRGHIKAYFSRNYSVALATKMTGFFLSLCEKAGMEAAALKQTTESKQTDRSRGTRLRESPSQKRSTARQQTTSQGALFEASRGPVDQSEVASTAAFLRKYIDLVDGIKISLNSPRTAGEVRKLKNELIDDAIEKLAELTGPETSTADEED